MLVVTTSNPILALIQAAFPEGSDEHLVQAINHLTEARAWAVEEYYLYLLQKAQNNASDEIAQAVEVAIQGTVTRYTLETAALTKIAECLE
jgi:hypothetical protein